MGRCVEEGEGTEEGMRRGEGKGEGESREGHKELGIMRGEGVLPMMSFSNFFLSTGNRFSM